MKAIFAALLFVVASAHAEQVFDFALQGSGTHVFSPFECPTFTCTPANFPWVGTVTFNVDGTEDGTYFEDKISL